MQLLGRQGQGTRCSWELEPRAPGKGLSSLWQLCPSGIQRGGGTAARIVGTLGAPKCAGTPAVSAEGALALGVSSWPLARGQSASGGSPSLLPAPSPVKKAVTGQPLSGAFPLQG